ncbi:MAG: hypothetical protein A2Y23_14305 [Clostridiales bacterium GWB2_37_7]|nr:MAG: hypothetical protein A2Y23_14305 [Clostridiales bacterium GWB2_37_7]
MKEHISYKLKNIFIVIIFNIAIFVPFVFGILEKDKISSFSENRTFSQLPDFPKTINDINMFPQEFSNYYSDHLGFRDWFIKYYKLVKFSLGDSPSPDVTIGQDGWLFLGGITKGYKNYNDPIGDARNVNLYSESDLKLFAKRMVYVKDWLKEKGIAYVFVIAPDKHTIYPEKLPKHIYKENEISATDQAVKYLREYTDVNVIDLRDTLTNKKTTHNTYSKLGTHWNAYGASIAQYKIIEEIEKIFPKQILPEFAPLKTPKRGDMGLAKLIGVDFIEEHDLYPVFEKFCTPNKKIYNSDGRQNPRQTFTMICDDQQLDTIIFRDSFFLQLEPYFSRKFRRSTYIWEKLNYNSLVKYMELEKPDIVIEEWAERIFPYVPSSSSMLSFKSLRNKDIFAKSDETIFSLDIAKLKLIKSLELKKSR